MRSWEATTTSRHDVFEVMLEDFCWNQPVSGSKSMVRLLKLARVSMLR